MILTVRVIRIFLLKITLQTPFMDVPDEFQFTAQPLAQHSDIDISAES